MTTSRPNASADFVLRKAQVGGATLSILVCAPLEKAGFVHGFSTRAGGVSPMPKNDLNLAYREDPNENVDENRHRFLSALGENRPVITCHQTHSSRAHFFTAVDNPSAPELDGDALATDRSDVFVGVKTADCVPILVGDPSSGVVAAIHAGWRGALGRVVEKTLARLRTQNGFNPQNAIAAIGPSACVDCYEVGPEVMDVFKKEFAYGDALLQKNCLDVPQANVRQLMDAGVSPANIYVSQYCTMRDTNLFFSHRREGNNPSRRAVGRLLAVIGKN